MRSRFSPPKRPDAPTQGSAPCSSQEEDAGISGLYPNEDWDDLTRWQSGDIHAGQHLYDRHASGLLQLFFAIEPGMVRDRLESTFRALFAVNASNRPFRVELYATACRDLVKLGPEVSEAVDATIVEDGRGPAGSAEDSARRLLRRALDSVPLEVRLPLELHHRVGLSADEVEAVLSDFQDLAWVDLRGSEGILLREMQRFEDEERSTEASWEPGP